MKQAVIFGAGKIARGFVAQLLYLSGYEVTFFDVDATLIEQLNQDQRYHVHILGNPEKDSIIDHYHAELLDHQEALVEALEHADYAFTSVGGKNLTSLGAKIGQAYQLGVKRSTPLNIITCENWKDAGLVLKQAILAQLPKEVEERIAVSEGVVMRIATQPSPQQLALEPLGVWVQDFWELPINQATFVGKTIDVQGMNLIPNFGRFLEQKLYTNNTSNAFIAYVGYLLGYRIVAEAANAPQLQPMLDELYEEINQTLIQELQVEEGSQRELAEKARKKYSDWEIVDQIIRHGKDPIRKLGPQDRLIAPARMALRHGIQPHMMVKAIAAALYFDEASDPSAQELMQMRKRNGIPAVLKEVCQLQENEELYSLILSEVSNLQKEGIVHE